MTYRSHVTLKTMQSARCSAALCAVLAVIAAPLAAENAEIAVAVPQSSANTNEKVFVPATTLAQFRPQESNEDHRIDFSYFDEALEWFVVPMGPSIREGARRVEATLGTRRIYGHESRYRLEGNRVAFSYFTDDVRA